MSESGALGGDGHAVAGEEALVGNRVAGAFATPLVGWILEYLAIGAGNAD